MIIEELFKLRDEKYAEFQSKLTPGVAPELFIGVRVPDIRKLAKRLLKENKEETDSFINTLPHKYYDENMLHGLLLSEEKNFDKCIKQVDAFLPFVDNWAVCDIMSPKCFKKNKDTLLTHIRKWCESKETYTVRFGAEMLMSHYLDADFKAEYLEIPAGIESDEYYVKMMVAWFFATALAKQWEFSVPYIENKRLSPWIHNKTIQKSAESYRITDEQKSYLRTLKV